MNKFIKSLKNFFIPHKHNGYKPHIYREVSVAVTILAAIFLLSISAATVTYLNDSNAAAVLPAVLVDLTNNVRTANNEQTLTRNPILDKAAQLKAEDMAASGYFAHTSPAGITPWHWFDKAGYYFSYAGENLAINFTESSDVESAWLNSPTHKANIMNTNFTEIGIATVDGMFEGRPTTYVVQMFGKPAFKPISVPKVVPTTKQVKSNTTLTKKSSEKPTTIALAPTVKGESVGESSNLVTIQDTKEFVAVKNNEVDANASSQVPQSQVKYSHWYDMLAFLTPKYIDNIYHAFMWIVLFCLLAMGIVEIRIQHPKNIVYGILLLFVMLGMIYINQHVYINSIFS